MTGTIAKLVEEKRFGFIKGNDQKQYFFHQTGFNGFFDDLIEDISQGLKIEVTFDIESSSKGPRATNVSRLDEGRGVPSAFTS